MISIVITSYKEPKTIARAVESFLKQEIDERFELIVSAPDKETLDAANEYAKRDKRIKIFQDPGKGKTYALNLLLPKLKGEIIFLSDGDVYVSDDSLKKMLELFKDKKTGCVTGKPVPTNSRENIYGYWSYLLCHAAHKMRLKRDKKKEFLECSGYLWAFRNKIIQEIPRETAEDTIVPILFYTREYRIRYSPDSEVYVKYPSNFKEFIEQKKRTAKAHETLKEYVNLENVPRMKSFKNEIFESYEIFSYPKNIKELFWTLFLFPIRLYVWVASFFRLYIRQDSKVDNWNRLESTK